MAAVSPIFQLTSSSLLRVCFITALICLSGVQSQPRDSNFSQGLQAPCSTPASVYGLPACTLDTNDSFIVRHHSRVRNPSDVHGQAQPTLLDHIRLLEYQPDFAIIVSVHNQDRIIFRNLEAIFNLTQGIWQLIVVLDDCSDNTLNESRSAVRKHVSSYVEIFRHMMFVPDPGKHGQAKWECRVRQALRRGIAKDSYDESSQDGRINPKDVHAESTLQVSLHSLLTEVSFIEQSSSVWETTSDNIGMAYAAPSKYFILVQADMWMSALGWNTMLSRPAELFSDIFSVSARCAHSFVEDETPGYLGRCGADIETLPSPEKMKEFQHSVYIQGTVNRGPLLLRSDRVIALGLLDEENFMIGMDDHDLMARALLKFNWKAAGYFAVQFMSPLDDGSTRTQSNFTSRNGDFKYARNQRINVDANKARLQAAELVTVQEIRNITDADIQHVTNFWNQRIAYTLCCASESHSTHSK